jgi:uncharacterized protein (UPF0335 family)
MGDLAHDPKNTNHEALKGFVDRLFTVEQEFADVKAEYADSKKDLKSEIKGKVDETGVTVAQVEALVKIRLNESEALDHQADVNANAMLYEQVFGFNATPEAADEADEDDALG